MPTTTNYSITTPAIGATGWGAVVNAAFETVDGLVKDREDDLTAHAAAADPHAGYQLESEKGAANGYAELDADGLVPVAQLPAVGSALCGGLGIPGDDGTRYAELYGRSGWANEGDSFALIARAGTFQNLRIRTTLALGSGQSLVATLRVNEADSDLTVTLTATEQTGADTTHSVNVVAGDRVDLKLVATGSLYTQTRFPIFGLEFVVA